jgi:hypothetical protein
MAAIAAMAFGRRQPEERPVAKYHVRFEARCPGEDTVETVRSRMGLLNEAMRRTVRGARDFSATYVDYESGVLELDVWTDQLSGIKIARVDVSVERLSPAA